MAITHQQSSERSLKSLHPEKRNHKRFIFIPDKKYKKQIKRVLGFKPVKHKLYQLALIHKSASGKFSSNYEINNERLEFLGDAILDSIVSEHLYNKFPDKDEGFLTQMRSKIVNRETLRNVAIKMGINKLVIAHLTKDNHKSLYGDALEALIGAIYLDKGYKAVNKFILKKIFKYYIDLDELSETEIDFKSRIIEWGQKNKKDINFTCQEQLDGDDKIPVFISHLLVFDDIVGMGLGKSKKEAEQNAARQAIQIIGL
ncbi:MAG: ribonuclease III [Bacteroidales bacterium]|nr:ribonuclease III [Bacteroidales bacterium]